MAKIIEVEERDINYILSKAKPYSLDVYQRDYRWSDEGEYKIVSQLLLDIELRFENNLKLNKRNQSQELVKILNDVEQNFSAYLLNTILLNEQEGSVFIVDGQQRLTTVLLILIKLYQLGMLHDTKGMNVKKAIGERIYEEDLASQKNFKISNQDRNDIIKKIFEGEPINEPDITNITQANLVKNYKVISLYFDRYLFDNSGAFLAEKYNYYVYNLLLKVLIIEQIIKNKQDVAMIFETANDRGKELEPHEVLKGMLLGVLDNNIKEQCNSIWNEALRKFFKISGNYQNVDEFFRTYFRAKYADNQNQYQLFAGKYHRNLLSNDKILKDLDRSNPSLIERFIRNEFFYFYTKFLELTKAAINESNLYLACNYANDQGQQFLLILSALTHNDSEETDKINVVAKKFDQFYSLSRLVGVYDNNDMQKVVYDLNVALRNKPLRDLEMAFDSITLPYFASKGLPLADIASIFDYKYFKNMRVDGRFTKYILARVDHYLAGLLNEQSFARQEKLHFVINSGNRPSSGFHIEHMFSYNDKIIDQFKDANGTVDEKLFQDERNRLGAVMLMKGNENIRTSNWLYSKKFSSYSNSGFIWNRILTDSINKASLNNCSDPIKHDLKSYPPDADGLLSRNAIEERQELLFKIITKIYSI